jgi:hypothetical protein
LKTKSAGCWAGGVPPELTCIAVHVPVADREKPLKQAVQTVPLLQAKQLAIVEQDRQVETDK